MSKNIPARLSPLLEFAHMLTETAKAPRKPHHDPTRKGRGSTLRPGPDTPLWNELAKLAASHLTRYGDKANLARILGVPRQRIHEYLVAKTAYPDTERSLILLAWTLNQQTATSDADQPDRSLAEAASSVTTSPQDEPTPEVQPQTRKEDDDTYYVTLMPPSLD